MELTLRLLRDMPDCRPLLSANTCNAAISVCEEAGLRSSPCGSSAPCLIARCCGSSPTMQPSMDSMQVKRFDPSWNADTSVGKVIVQS